MLEWIKSKTRDGGVQVYGTFIVIAFIVVWLESGINYALEYSGLLIALLVPLLISTDILLLIRKQFFKHVSDKKPTPISVLTLVVLLVIVVHLILLDKLQTNVTLILNLLSISSVWTYIIVMSRK